MNYVRIQVRASIKSHYFSVSKLKRYGVVSGKWFTAYDTTIKCLHNEVRFEFNGNSHPGSDNDALVSLSVNFNALITDLDEKMSYIQFSYQSVLVSHQH